MHNFFGAEPPPFEFRSRLYARLIDWEIPDYALFDCVDAEFFDRVLSESGGEMNPQIWSAEIDKARIFAVEINAGSVGPVAAAWLETNDVEDMLEWQELTLAINPEGPAEVYNNIAGVPLRATVTVKKTPNTTGKALEKAVDLKNDIKSDTDIENALPAHVIEQIFVLDVGQGSANALVDTAGQVIAYVDLGAGTLKNTGTWPSSPMTICLAHQPTVILTHWHYDHFEAANKFPLARRMTWIAPNQTLGPGPQSAMATALRTAGGLKVWNGSRGSKLKRGAIEIERCTGKKNQNRTGLAVWVDGPTRGDDPMLLPGDAGYSDIGSLAGRTIAGLVVSHHGGVAAGQPPAKPKAGARLAFSYGFNNKYKHPLNRSIAGLTKAGVGWNVGHPAAAIDERRTEDRKTTGGLGSTGGSGLGHILLDWAAGASAAHTCTCGCTLDPTQ